MWILKYTDKNTCQLNFALLEFIELTLEHLDTVNKTASRLLKSVYLCDEIELHIVHRVSITIAIARIDSWGIIGNNEFNTSTGCPWEYLLKKT